MPLRLTFHGAARCVTGSCFRLETEHGQLLVDCGMFQGPKTEKELNYRPFPFAPGDLGAVILSHAHIDHAGLLPKLTRHGYRGPIYATPATVDLAGVMLPDSAYIQESEVEQLNRRNARPQPAAGRADLPHGRRGRAASSSSSEVAYSTWFEPLPGRPRALLERRPSPRLGLDRGRGHGRRAHRPPSLLRPTSVPTTSCSIPTRPGRATSTTSSARAPMATATASTPPPRTAAIVLRDEVRAAINPKGAMLIPSFAVERAQELISDLVQLMHEGQLPEIPIYVDSPLASKATQVFAEHAADLDHGDDLIRGLKSRNVRFTQTVEESKALDRLDGFHIVIAASGMCEAGRIRHRLKNWIWRAEATVLLVGFQAQGTLGRILKDGATEVRIQGDEFKVKARIRAIDLYSGHADGPELAAWIGKRLPLRHQLFLIHGEVPSLLGLQARLAGVLDAGADRAAGDRSGLRPRRPRAPGSLTVGRAAPRRAGQGRASRLAQRRLAPDPRHRRRARRRCRRQGARRPRPPPAPCAGRSR